MQPVPSFATVLAACLQVVSAFHVPLQLIAHDISPSLTRMHIELGSKLCKGSSIYIADSPDSRSHIERWSKSAKGDILIVVTPTCEKDVAVAVPLPSS